jgi:hypothetical protein
MRNNTRSEQEVTENWHSWFDKDERWGDKSTLESYIHYF